MIQIITDSSSLYSPEKAKARGFYSLPLYVCADSECYRDFEEIDAASFSEMIRDAKKLGTSQPSIGEKLDLYNKLLENKEDIILDICISDKLSGTYQAALSAKENCDDPQRVTVFNSETLCGPQKAMVEKALEMRDGGKSLEEILDVLNDGIKQEASSLCVLDMNNLVRSGRLNKTAGAAGKLLKIMPVAIKDADGKLSIYGMARTWKKAIEIQNKFLSSKGMDDTWTLYITHGNNPDAASKAKAYFQQLYPGLKIEVQPLNAMFMVHGGEGCVALQAIKI